MLWALSRHQLAFITHPLASSAMPGTDILWLAPVCVFGFALCPWLDGTFHTARQALSRREARAAFAIGFGAIFALMILFTWGYSGWLAPAHAGGNLSAFRIVFPLLAMILCAHLIVHSGLTVALHARQLAGAGHNIRIVHFLFFSLTIAAAVAAGIAGGGPLTYNRLGLGEIFYRCFLVFYALIFPAYVWLRMVPPRRSMFRLWTVIFMAMPFYWLGFIELKMIWLLPAVLIPLLGKIPGEIVRRPPAEFPPRGTSERGNSQVTVVPLPRTDSSLTLPPRALTACLTMASPSPVPRPALPLRAEST